LVENPNDSAASVRGTFIYQRKGSNDLWEDSDNIPLSRLKKGEEFKLELHAGEMLTLFHEVETLYQIHEKEGIRLGMTEYVSVDSAATSLTSINTNELRTYLTANYAIGSRLLEGLLSWAAELDDPQPLITRLISLGPTVLSSINVAIGLERLRHVLGLWEDNNQNSDEEFWQDTLAEHSFVLEQVFSWPSTVVKGKAYMGGKSVLNSGGNIVDFLVRNYFTSNAALVEIKTPGTKLLAGRQYRGSIYNVSEDLGGAVMQILNYRYNLQRDFYSLSHGLTGGLEAFEPRCVVIIGAMSEIQGDEEKARSLELYRNQLSSVSIITYTELFEKMHRLIAVLESST
jgi:hypothetical protein